MSETNTPAVAATPAMPPASVVLPAAVPAHVPAQPAAVAAPAPAEAPVLVENAGQNGPGKSDAPAIGRDGAAEPSAVGETAAAPAEPEAPAPAAEPAAPFAYTDFKLPDGAMVAPKELAEATTVLAKYGVPQADAQTLIDLHAAGLKSAVDAYSKTATDYWNDKSKTWVAEAKKDPQFGGNRFDASLKLARGVWTEVLPNKADQEQLFGVLSDTKVGDNPVLFRAMAEVGRRMQQVMTATGTTTWDAAMKKIGEPAAPPPGNPARAPGSSGRAADRRYAR